MDLDNNNNNTNSGNSNNNNHNSYDENNDNVRPGDDHQTEQLISDEDDNCCVICYDRKKNIQCLPCKHIVCCYECLIRLACETYVNNGDKEECPICKTTIDVFRNIDTEQRLMPGDIQDEFEQDVEFNKVQYKYNRERENKQGAEHVEQHEIRQVFGSEDERAQQQLHQNNDADQNNDNRDIDLDQSSDNDLSDSDEYGEDNYSVGEITAEDMRILRTMRHIQKRSREEYVPESDVEEEVDENDDYNYDQHALETGATPVARRTRTRLVVNSNTTTTTTNHNNSGNNNVNFVSAQLAETHPSGYQLRGQRNIA